MDQTAEAAHRKLISSANTNVLSVASGVQHDAFDKISHASSNNRQSQTGLQSVVRVQLLHNRLPNHALPTTRSATAIRHADLIGR